MMCLLTEQNIFTLQCPCRIWSNIAIIIQIHPEVYGSLKETKFLLIMLIWLLIILNRLNTKQLLLGKKAANDKDRNSFVKDTKIVVPLKYLSNFWRSLEMPLINCKVHFELNLIEDSILSSAGNSAKFEIKNAKLHVPIVTLSSKDSINLTKQLSEGFKRSFYWNSYQTKPAIAIEKGANVYELLNGSFQGVRRLFVLAYVVAAGKKYNKIKIIFFQ